jgi:hypothetical protein
LQVGLQPNFWLSWRPVSRLRCCRTGLPAWEIASAPNQGKKHARHMVWRAAAVFRTGKRKGAGHNVTYQDRWTSGVTSMTKHCWMRRELLSFYRSPSGVVRCRRARRDDGTLAYVSHQSAQPRKTPGVFSDHLVKDVPGLTPIHNETSRSQRRGIHGRANSQRSHL